MKKTISVFVSVLLFLSLFTFGVNAKDSDTMPVKVNAKSAILMDQTTGKVLMSMNQDERLYPASVTKIMTMLLVAEAIDDGKISMDDTVTASANAVKKGGSQIWLKEGETMSVKELYKALPYIVTILVLIMISMRRKKENSPPAHLGLPYFREDR